MSTCEDIQAELSAYLDGELTAEEKQALDAHLSACKTCSAELTELASVRNMLGALPKLKAPPTLAAKVSVQINTPVIVHGHFNSQMHRKMLALAAIVMLGVLIFLATSTLAPNRAPTPAYREASAAIMQKAADSKLPEHVADERAYRGKDGIEFAAKAPAENGRLDNFKAGAADTGAAESAAGANLSEPPALAAAQPKSEPRREEKEIVAEKDGRVVAEKKLAESKPGETAASGVTMSGVAAANAPAAPPPAPMTVAPVVADKSEAPAQPAKPAEPVLERSGSIELAQKDEETQGRKIYSNAAPSPLAPSAGKQAGEVADVGKKARDAQKPADAPAGRAEGQVAAASEGRKVAADRQQVMGVIDKLAAATPAQQQQAQQLGASPVLVYVTADSKNLIAKLRLCSEANRGTWTTFADQVRRSASEKGEVEIPPAAAPRPEAVYNGAVPDDSLESMMSALEAGLTAPQVFAIEVGAGERRELLRELYALQSAQIPAEETKRQQAALALDDETKTAVAESARAREFKKEDAPKVVARDRRAQERSVIWLKVFEKPPAAAATKASAPPAAKPAAK